MAPPYQISHWYGGRPTCHTASGATDNILTWCNTCDTFVLKSRKNRSEYGFICLRGQQQAAKPLCFSVVRPSVRCPLTTYYFTWGYMSVHIGRMCNETCHKYSLYETALLKGFHGHRSNVKVTARPNALSRLIIPPPQRYLVPVPVPVSVPRMPATPASYIKGSTDDFFQFYRNE